MMIRPDPELRISARRSVELLSGKWNHPGRVSAENHRFSRPRIFPLGRVTLWKDLVKKSKYACRPKFKNRSKRAHFEKIGRSMVALPTAALLKPGAQPECTSRTPGSLGCGRQLSKSWAFRVKPILNSFVPETLHLAAKPEGAPFTPDSPPVGNSERRDCVAQKNDIPNSSIHSDKISTRLTNRKKPSRNHFRDNQTRRKPGRITLPK